ncbi:hypothetical protein GCM10027515_19910 [Schumannella luteola]|uniref:DUF4365 domain-containing protein n=1 Tax=Schumannella luteola TaxID=472059 RepID=A0A852YCG2_9MICO|nr:hypothetical protein [Schumannella luteola]NYH00214.1 hypothetical protein [Schumannella luteola]TPX04037.1 hypothetical protein FJ656_13625 [Schumannella luteola]
MSVELFAVTAVVDRIAACPLLAPEIKSGDKVPITDGHIDFYSSARKSNMSHVGRVPVQVKGRATATKVKASRDSQSFPIEREVLQFFRNHGGGIYFYVPMRKGGAQREVFYVILLPFKIGRLVDGKPDTQRSFSVKMRRLPEEVPQIEAIVRLTWNGRVQTSNPGDNDVLLDQAESLTVHSLDGFDENRPTRLALADTDYVVVAHLPGGLEVAMDIDLEVLPREYLERDLAVSIKCGEVEFTNARGRRLQADTTLIRLSSGLKIRLRADAGAISAHLDLTREGSFRAQAKNFDFMLAAASGSPLQIGDGPNEPQAGDPGLQTELRSIRQEISCLTDLFDELGIDDGLSSELQLDDDLRRMLLAMHEGLVQDQPVRGNSDGTGRYDFSVGDYKIMAIVMPAEEPGFRRIIDPFDPTKRDRFQIYRIDDDGSPELIDWATVYESVTAEEMAMILNLRLNNLVDSYANLEDRQAALTRANYTVLRLLTAADIASSGVQRANLLNGALSLCQWLMTEDPDSLVHRVNSWQILHRRGELGDDVRREIRATRRGLPCDDAQARELEACMLILLGDEAELEVVIEELTEVQVKNLRSWPVWALRNSEPKPVLAIEN